MPNCPRQFVVRCCLALTALLAVGNCCAQTPTAGFQTQPPNSWVGNSVELEASSHPLVQERLDRHLAGLDGRQTSTAAKAPSSDFHPWWEAEQNRPLLPSGNQQPIDLDLLLIDALRYSPQVRSLQETEFIRSTAIVEAEAEFDIRAFMESKFQRTSDPVGDQLTTGGPSRFRDSTWYYAAGARRRNREGSSLELSQRLGYRDNNSLFLDPTQQGNARLSLSLTKPIWRGSGRAYNESRIVLAQLDTRAAHGETTAALEDHLVEVARAYWDLHLRRTVLLQKQRHLQRGESILKRLEDRRNLDSMPSQILSARAAVEMRRAELNRAGMAIQNAESRLRILVAAPHLLANQGSEFVPATELALEGTDVPLADALATAVHHRAEIDLAIQRTRAAGRRLEMSTHELLPILDLVFETYVAGLQGQSRVGRAWLNQFSVGEPGYTAGLVFEVPLHNRAARARHQRRQAELRQVVAASQAIVDTTLLEVKIAWRALQTAHHDIGAHLRSMTAMNAEVKYLQDRWLQLPGDDRSASFLLEDLLRAEDRLANAEYAYAESRVAFAMAQVDLKRAMGILLMQSRVPSSATLAVEHLGTPPAPALVPPTPRPQTSPSILSPSSSGQAATSLAAPVSRRPRLQRMPPVR